MLKLLWLGVALNTLGGDLAPFNGFTELAEDPPPENLTRNSHYWVSNEYRHDVYQETIKDLGGVHIGVGTDQNYLLAGWSRPELIILMDFDAAVPRLHWIYRLQFAEAETPEAFLKLWSPEGVKATQARIEAAYADRADFKKIKRVFKAAQKSVYARLRASRRRYQKRGVDIWLTDQAQYAYIRDLWAKGRVIPVRGDLTGKIALRDIGEKLRAHELLVRTMYTSNAEQYFKYGEGFRANIEGLPTDARSVMLHTMANGRFKKADGHYHYSWQRFDDFKINLKDPKMKNLRRIIRDRRVDVAEGVSQLIAPKSEPAKAAE